MTRRWLFRITLTVLPAVVISLSAPSVARAQPQNPPPPAVPGPPVAQTPPPPVAPAVVERPMRFILTGGTVVIGTRTAEDAEFFTVNTANGLVRVRKSDVASMDYNTTAGTAAPQVAPSPQLPPPTFNYTATRPSRPGRGLLIAGTIMFSITYGLTVFGATIASVDNSDAFLLLLPVAGPVVYAAVADEDTDDGSLALFINLTILQGAGLIMLIIGASKGSSSSSNRENAHSMMPNEFRLGQADVRVDPVVTPGLQGLAVSGHF